MLTAHSALHIENEVADVREVFAKANSADDVIKEIDRQKGLLNHIADTGKVRWGLKDPLLTYCLPRLAELFPESPVLFTMRDGRAVASSHLRLGFGAVNNVYAAARRWKDDVELHEQFLRDHAHRTMVVRYETLVREPEQTLKTIAQFIGEPFEERMVRYFESDTVIKKNRFNESTFSPPDPENIDKWKGALSNRQVDVFESVAGRALEAHGYERLGSGWTLPAPMALYYKIHHRVMEEWRWQRRKFSQSANSE